MATLLAELVAPPPPAPRPAPRQGARPTSETRRCARLLAAWLVVRTGVWTALAAWSQPNAALDLIEWLCWGHEWRWGYPKHPPLPAWLAEAFARPTPGSVWGVYLAGYLVTAVCLWAAWELGREMLPPRLALWGALALEGLIFFTYDPAEFNNNVVLNACWALTAVSFYRAVRTGRSRWWLAAGVAGGLGLLSKYTIVFLLAPLGALLVWRPEGRRCRARPGVYLAAAAAACLFVPHAVWVVRNHFITLRYGAERSADAGGWPKHLTNPLVFALSQAGRLVPVLFVLAPLLGWRRRDRAAAPGSFDRSFLLFAVVGPVALHLLVSLALGVQLREIWGSPLWTFAGVLALFAFGRARPSGFAHARLHLAVVVLLFWASTLARNAWEPWLTGTPKRIHFPGRRLAEELTRAWGARFGGPFRVVAGDCWLAGNVGCYAPHRPTVYSDGVLGYLVLDARSAPWSGDEDLLRRGGVLLWDAGRLGDGLPPVLRHRFPDAEPRRPLLLPYACGAPVAPARVGVAFVAPGEGR